MTAHRVSIAQGHCEEMERILTTVKRVREKLERMKGVEIVEFSLTEPLEERILEGIESTLGFNFPGLLRTFFLEDSSSLIFRWNVLDRDFLGRQCGAGRLHILGPDNVLDMWNDQSEYVQEVKKDNELLRNAGMQALVRDWPFWVPVLKFPNGDAFCLDKHSGASSDEYSIKFFEHDVMDGGPFIHGQVIAKSFEDLIDKWSQIGFVDFFDWSLITNQHGLDLTSKKLTMIKSIFEE